MSKHYDIREVTHGNEWAAFSAFELVDGKIVFEKPEILTGLVNTSFDESQEETDIYADNVTHMRLLGNPNVEGSTTVLQIKRKFMIDHLGKKEMANGMLTDGRHRKNFAFQYMKTVENELGESYNQLHIYYNVRAGSVTNESETNGEGVEHNEFEIPMTAIPNPFVLDEDGAPVTHTILDYSDKTAPLFDLAYGEVILPTTTAPIASEPTISRKGENK